MGITSVGDLVQAIKDANASGPATIELVAGSTYTLTAVDNTTDGPNGLPSITGEITIEGKEAAIVRDDAAPNLRVFHVENTGKLTLTNLIIRNGHYSGDYGGGAILNKGTLTLRNCRVSDNYSASDGGGIYNQGKLKIDSSRLERNSADNQGGAIYNDSQSGLKSAIIGLNVFNSSSEGWGALSATPDLLNGPWSVLQGGDLPETHMYGVPLICYLNLDPYTPDRAILFTQEGGIYQNEAWRSGGSWTTLVSPAAMLAAVQVEFPTMSTIYMQDAALSMAQQGLFYLILTETDDVDCDERPIVVRITNYKTVSVCPYELWFQLGIDSDVYPVGYFNIQASNINPNVFYVALTTNTAVHDSWRYCYVYKKTWGTWTPLSGGYLMPTTSMNIGSLIATTVFVPYYRADGTINTTENEVYHTGGRMSSGHTRIYRSVDGCQTFDSWGPGAIVQQTAEINNAATRRDMFEVQGKVNEMAFFIVEGTGSDGFYYIPRGLDPSQDANWTYKEFPEEVERVAWAGGWPFSDTLFYFGTGTLDYPYTGDIVVFLTQDRGVNFDDVSDNLRILSNYSGNNGNRHRVIRLSPHWTET